MSETFLFTRETFFALNIEKHFTGEIECIARG